MFFGDHRVVELIVLVVELDDGARQLRAFFQAQTGGDGTGGDVAHDHFQRNDLDFPDQLFAHVEAANEVSRDADGIQMIEDIFGNPVVEHAFAVNNLVFLVVEGSRVVLEVLNQGSRFRTFVKDLALTFVNAPAAVHRLYRIF